MMPRNMSFAITTQQVRERTKDVTRRLGWRNLRINEQVNAVEKAMGLRKGEKVVYLARICVADLRWERLDLITPDDVRREGFPDMTPDQFVAMFCKTHKGCTPESLVHRIAFRYLD